VRKLFALGAALTLIAAGCGGGKKAATTTRNTALDQSAAHFVVGVQADLRRGNFARAWRSLHPAQKRAVSRPLLASCYPRNAFPRTVTFHATQVQDVTWQVPGSNTFSEAKEVTVTAKSAGKTVDTFTQHVVRVGGAWTWMLSAAFFRAAKRGTC
jgi:hypothetical protein